ncbi:MULTISPECIES: hypothetical protein [Halobacterium]|uniref:hypothetical protein n=1 Tax=Halobacterium TaxID=2239 RepID=UPI00073F1EAC|nr:MULTISPECIES: hypothetical protein [Halobacterium]MCG1002860.1 hypothetical protein [Halobacterium noricense]
MTRYVSLSVGAVLAVLLTLLAASAVPVSAANTSMAASDGLVVGSTHNTDSDFQSGTLTNFTTSGTGSNATLTLADGEVIDSFEDGNLDEYTGDTADWTTTTNQSTDGSRSLYSDAYFDTQTYTIQSGSGLPAYPQPGNTWSFDYRASGPAGTTIWFGPNSSTHYNLILNSKTEVIKLGSTESSNELDSASVTIPDNEWLSVDVDWATNDTMSITVTDSTGATVATLTGQGSISSGGFLAWSAFGDAGAERWIDNAATGVVSPDSAQYISPLHGVSNAEEAAINVTAFSNVSVEATVQTDGGTVLNQSSLSGTGNQTLALAETSSDELETVLDVSVTGSNPEFSVGDESILFTNHQPQVSNLSPADGAELTDESVEFTADISDEDFQTAQGDSVEARLFVDGEQVGSQTVTSNQTVSVTHNITQGGAHEYYWELQDEYGSGVDVTTDTFTLNTPSELDIYNITSAQTETPELVDNASVEVRMYQGNTIYERTAENGTVDLSGISPAEPFVAVVDAPGYYSRRIFVESQYDRQRVYLLPDNRTRVDVIFNLQEYTGKYPQDDTILQVQRAINGSWETALGDYFGANAQFPATLEYNTRYRLRLVNIESGESRLLGSFTPITSSTQNVVVAPSGDVNVTSLDAVWELMETKSMPATSVPFNASLQTGNADIQSWNVTVSYVENGTTQQLYHANSSTASSQTVETELNLSEKAGGEVHVVASYKVEGGTVQTFTRSYRVSEYFANGNALIPSLTQFVSLVPEGNQPAFTTFLAMMLTVLVTSGVMYTTPMSTEIAGMLAWLLIAGFAIIGWVSYEMVFVAGVAAGSLVYLRRPI